MNVTTILLIFLVFGSVQPHRLWHGGGRSRAHGRGRLGMAKRFAPECTRYREAGEKHLDCQDRQLTAIPPSGWPEDTVHLLLARNRLQVLRSNTFAQFRFLKSLDLQQNKLMRIDADAFAGLSRLTTLLLQHNSLHFLSEEVLLPLPRLTYLRLYDNPWDCQCQLDSLVRTLQVPSNRNLGNFAKCKEPPALHGQKLKRIRPELLCPELEERIPQEPKAGSSVLPPIRTKPEAIDTCHTYMFPKPLLDCGNQDLRNVPENIPPDIVQVDLSRNNIKQLRASEFVAARALKSLNLSTNGLEAIDTAAFAGLLHLRELDLSNNSLHYVQYGVLEDLYFVRRLVLGGNPWVCDYNIHYLVYWLKLHPGVQHFGLVCRSPEKFAGWTVQDYVKTYNGDCPEDNLLDQNNYDYGEEVRAETNEEAITFQPSPLRVPKKFKVIRLN
ncbi:leucine-rich repeat-containing protein 17-like [Scleropages formosus]|uniref:Leucine rich repeat containing 17 n=1 Tax=Scleropages formosus TaxID=113540 RepID=A0A8C9R212_SCLFO|nr:leucine-rich repeat-containing protein 17 [Scleropages formosus]XP_018602774.1 leucine-rich repeat-containing protein 17 [Scleropages formosus]